MRPAAAVAAAVAATLLLLGAGGAEAQGADGRVFQDVPAEWTCEPAYYGANDGCDCACGVQDPDCDDPEAFRDQVFGPQVFGCDHSVGFGATCVDGECAAPAGATPLSPVEAGGPLPAGNLTVPSGWTCDIHWFGVLDGW